MVRLYHTDGKVYYQSKNKNNSTTLFEEDTNIPLLTITTDYKVIEIPSCEIIGKINCVTRYLVFMPVIGKIVRSNRLEATPEDVLEFHNDIYRWWLDQNRK